MYTACLFFQGQDYNFVNINDSGTTVLTKVKLVLKSRLRSIINFFFSRRKTYFLLYYVNCNILFIIISFNFTASGCLVLEITTYKVLINKLKRIWHHFFNNNYGVNIYRHFCRKINIFVRNKFPICFFFVYKTYDFKFWRSYSTIKKIKTLRKITKLSGMFFWKLDLFNYCEIYRSSFLT